MAQRLPVTTIISTLFMLQVCRGAAARVDTAFRSASERDASLSSSDDTCDIADDPNALMLRRAFGTRARMDTLVDQMVGRGAVRTPRVCAVMRMVDRKWFVNDKITPAWAAYEDRPQPIGQDQTISAPHMHATCLELLQEQLTPGARVLDVGSGSGYLTACMALMVGPSGFVLGIEKVPELARQSIANIHRSNPELMPHSLKRAEGQGRGQAKGSSTLVGEGVNFQIWHGNALSDALEGEQPFAAIHVGAAADELPELLVRLLQPGGRMIIPLGRRWESQVLTVVDKDRSGRTTSHELMGVMYVPLTRPSEMADQA